MDERDDSSLYKAHRMIMSEYKTVSNYKKPRGITIFIKKKIGITLGNIEMVDENIKILRNLQLRTKQSIYLQSTARQTKTTRNSLKRCRINLTAVDTSTESLWATGTPLLTTTMTS